MVRELERNLEGKKGYEKMFELYYKVLSQNRKSKNKVYSLHEPDVVCISKGKEHKQYEFGNKVSILRSWSGLYSWMHVLLGMNMMGILSKRH